MSSIFSVIALFGIASIAVRRGNGAASACECVKVPSFENAFHSATTVLRIRIKNVILKENEKEASARVKKVFKGSFVPANETIRLVVDKEETSCHYFDFRKNSDYVILPTRNNNKLTVQQCSWSGMWKDLSRSRKDFLNLQLMGGSTPAFSIKTPDSDPLPATIRLVDESVAEGYMTCTELEDDLEQFMRFYASNRILHNIRNAFFLDGEWIVRIYPNPLDPDVPPQPRDDGEPEESYFTNNQIDGVDEADIVKSDGTFVYVAYGDTLVIFNASSGQEVARVVMPSPADVAWRRTECNIGEVGSPSSSQEAPQETAALCAGWSLHGKATIEGVLLQDSRLVLVVSGYRYNYFPYLDEDGAAPADTILSDRGSTYLRMYDTSTLGTDGVLTLLGAKDLRGQYRDGRSIGSMGHVATSANVNVGKYFDSVLQRSFNEMYRGMNHTDYETAAVAIAQEIIPVAASRIVEELNGDGLECRNVLKLAAYTTADFGEDSQGVGEITSDDARLSLANVMGFRTVVLLTSFDMNQAFNDEEMEDMESEVDIFTGNSVATIATSSAAAFFTQFGPSIITSSERRMMLTGNGYHWNEMSQTLDLRTYLLVFSLPSTSEEGPAAPYAFGAVEGHPVNNYSLDEYDGTIRIGTTQMARSCPHFRTTYYDDSPVLHCVRWDVVSKMRNQLVVLRYHPSLGPATMTEIGRVRKLGKRGERLFALRLDGDKAFAVTARLTDPFYTLNLSDPAKPRKAGKLDIPGFSSYLHVIEDGKFVLAVGEEAGNVAVSLFDVKDFENPTLAARYVVGEEGDSIGGGGGVVWSQSDANFDTKAWRFLPKSKTILLPMQIKGDVPQDGFLVLSVNTKRGSIRPKFLIDHLEGLGENGCYSPSYLPSRSLVFDNKATTMKGHVVVSTDLATAERRWMLSLDDDETEDCNGWF